MPPLPKPPWRVIVVLVVGLAVLAGGIALVTRHVKQGSRVTIVPHCLAGAGSAGDPTAASYTLDLEQAANASTISAIGKRLGLPDHAVTVALAVVLQESKLRNVGHGDRDSLGLFQQRPSQGWGTDAQVMDPHYSAVAFYQHLTKVRDWESITVADAGQRVQHSASGDAYAQWEPQARVLAAALTGEVAAGLACQFEQPATITASAAAAAGPNVAAISPSVTDLMTTELGSAELDVPLGPARGWAVAGWLVSHAAQFRIAAVSFGGQRWTPAAGAWAVDPSAGPKVHMTTVPITR